MSNRKHTYTEAEAPTNTGSLARPARLNLRLDCSTRARTHRAFQTIRELTGLPKTDSYADVWEKKMLFAIEHIAWHLKESPTAVKNFVRSLFDPLPQEDYVRNRYSQLKLRFEH